MIFDPRARAAQSAISVAGGHTAMSARAASSPPAAMILANSATERCRPFIFQLPATRGRRALAIVIPAVFSPFSLQPAVSRVPQATPGQRLASARGDRDGEPQCVAAHGGAPYD